MANVAVLIHGWNPDLYNKSLEGMGGDDVAWKRSLEFIKLLSEDFEIKYFNLRGFCGVDEPEEDRFNVEDFSDELDKWINDNKLKPRVIIGYSFGGAVALDYKYRHKKQIPTVLVSPAIKRKESVRSEIGGSVKKIIPKFLTEYLKAAYQYMASPYFRRGTHFLRLTYDQIVRRDLSPLLKEIDSNSLLLIYGENDTATPWSMVSRKVEKAELIFKIIRDGRHGIIRTHPKEVVMAIRNWVKV